MIIFNPFKVKKALRTFQEFQDTLTVYWQSEAAESSKQWRSNTIDSQAEINQKRDRLSRLIPHAEYYLDYLNLNLTIHQYPPPAIGGPIISYSAFDWPLAEKSKHSWFQKII
jgi:hypothetical protein